jgi:hypothetical protein
MISRVMLSVPPAGTADVFAMIVSPGPYAEAIRAAIAASKRYESPPVK